MTSLDALFPSASTASTGATINAPKQQLGQDDFMKLLVAQMNNQDPANPADNSAFLGQLAQFSMVSGIDKLGTSFDSVAGSLSSTQAMQAATLVGHQVLTDSNIATLDDGEGVAGQLTVPDQATGLNIQVRDSAGALIKTIPSTNFQAGPLGFMWDGTNDSGTLQAPGDYSVTASALVNGTQQAVALQLYSTVQSVMTAPGTNSVQLQLANQQAVNFSEVSQYR